MSNRKKLWTIFGPLIVAVMLVVGVFLVPWKVHYQPATLQRAADSLSPTVFKNRALKVAALSNQKANYVPFFGSSELNRMDRYHPAVMAARYHNYKPFLFGSRGTQSLPQLFNMAMMPQEMEHRKAVFIISPQWFVKQGVRDTAFQYYNSNYADLTWLSQANPRSPYDRYTAGRLATLMNNQGTVASFARKIAEGRALSPLDRADINVRTTMLGNQDKLFSRFFIKDNYGQRIAPQIPELPVNYNYPELIKQAKDEHADVSYNNSFGLLNSFYNQKVRKNRAKLAGSQRGFNYTQSPEYSDLEVVLNQFKKTDTNVIIMIAPVNARWEKFTGMSMKMYDQTVNKITFQLRSQGFNNILDYSKDGAKPGFMQDTIHIGWAGWVQFDHQISPFLEHPQPAPSYHMHAAFLKKDWQDLKPTKTNLKHFSDTQLK